MARPRLELQAILEDVLGSPNVYFQPPESIKMEYPAIVYNRDRSYDIAADNNVGYVKYKGYSVTHIDWDPDSPTLDKIEALPMTSYLRHFNADGLNNDVFLIYF